MTDILIPEPGFRYRRADGTEIHAFFRDNDGNILTFIDGDPWFPFIFRPDGLPLFGLPDPEKNVCVERLGLVKPRNDNEA